MRLAFVNPWSGRTIGPNIGMRQLAQEACRRGHEVHIFSPTTDDYLEENCGSAVQVHNISDLGLAIRSKTPLQMLGHFWKAFYISRWIGHKLREINADLLCVNSENMLFAPRASVIAKVPCVVIVRGARFAKLGKLGRMFFRIQQRWVDVYFGVSQIVVDGLQTVGIPSCKCRKVYNGVDTNVFKPGPRNQELMKELGVADDELVVGAVCHYVPRKGVHHLIRVMSRLVLCWPELKCVIVGGILNSCLPEEVCYAKSLPRLAEEYGVSDNIIFTGERSDIPELMRSFDVVVHPSETESFGRTIAEAMACGKPVVGFNIVAVGELIDNGKTGYLAPAFDEDAMADYISRLLGDSDIRTQFGKAGREKALCEYELNKNIQLAVDTLEEYAKLHDGKNEKPHSCSGVHVPQGEEKN